MKKIVFSVLLTSFLTCCKKEELPDSVIVNLLIISTNTPKNVASGMPIVSKVKCSGADLCYSFYRFDIETITERKFSIRAKSKYPNPAKGDIVCLEAIYYKDTTVQFNTSSPGQYILDFYNGDTLFKSDTVVVQ